jgi:hypothetical protein
MIAGHKKMYIKNIIELYWLFFCNVIVAMIYFASVAKLDFSFDTSFYDRVEKKSKILIIKNSIVLLIGIPKVSEMPKLVLA